jgi:hypothetical protein
MGHLGYILNRTVMANTSVGGPQGVSLKGSSWLGAAALDHTGRILQWLGENGELKQRPDSGAGDWLHYLREELRVLADVADEFFSDLGVPVDAGK